ncbi:hypothetical protein [Metabacillus schmidteae]|nr:hypothetical protein [Metabacillus schmidteae]
MIKEIAELFNKLTMGLLILKTTIFAKKAKTKNPGYWVFVVHYSTENI